jgi:acyl-coenzyme A synthetase/AMP-(fatty) acid ligase
VEGALIAHPAVVEAGVVGRQDEDGLVKPEAFVVLKDGQVPSAELAVELTASVRGRLAGYKSPRWVHFVAELPQTATGKLQRFRLRRSSG